MKALSSRSSMISPMRPNVPILTMSYILAPRQPEATTRGPATRIIFASLMASLSLDQRIRPGGLYGHLAHPFFHFVGQRPVIGKSDDHGAELPSGRRLFLLELGQPALVDKAEGKIPPQDPGPRSPGLR